jgi:hypothetical protein
MNRSKFKFLTIFVGNITRKKVYYEAYKNYKPFGC